MSIEELIPHRDPFLFVKKVIDQSQTSILTETSFSKELPMFKGHFPGNPVVPGVIITEAVLQSGALLMASQGSSAQTPVVSRINQAKFKNILRPDEVISIEVNLIEELSGAYFFKGKVKTDKTIMTIDFTCNLV